MSSPASSLEAGDSDAGDEHVDEDVEVTSSGAALGENLSKAQWRHDTAAERTVVASLGLLQNRDLAVHLYGAFAVKQAGKLYKQAYQQGAVSDVDARAELAWTPPKAWTAWPLPATAVPREFDSRPWGGRPILHGPYVSKVHRLSRDLQDLLGAQIQRTARQRLKARETEEVEETDDDGALSVTPSDSSENVVDSAEPGKPGPSRHRGRHAVKPASESEIEKMVPVDLTDDDLAFVMLRPSIQHELTKLDDLLLGLHHARISYSSKKSGKRSLQIRDSARQVKARTKRHGHVQSDDTGGSLSKTDSPRLSSPSIPKVTSHKRRALTIPSGLDRYNTRKKKLGLRDWSDVVGTGALIGIDSAVIQRTATRCAALFDEDMSFITTHEDGHASHRPSLVTSGCTTPGSQASDEASLDVYGGVSTDGYLEPIISRKSWKHSKTARKRTIRIKS